MFFIKLRRFSSVAGLLNNFYRECTGTYLVVQWLKLGAPKARGPGSIPGQGTRSHIPQLRVHMLQPRPSTAKYIHK